MTSRMRVSKVLFPASLFGALFLTLAVTASGQEVPKKPAEKPKREVIKLVVENNNFLDMHVYAMRDEVYRSLGVVTGLSQAELTIPELMTTPGADFEILADPIGSNLSYQTGPILMGSSRELHLILQGDLALSTFFVR